MNKNILLPVVVVLFLSISSCKSLPLSTKSRWIIDEHTGARVKLACVNWAGHLEPMLPEGLDKKPVAHIVNHITYMGFNCVRLTYATFMYTRYSHVTVAHSLAQFGLQEALQGMARNNPGFLYLSVVEAQRAVVEALVRRGVMVVLDNHVSEPMWCCNDGDGNGFFGDKYFDPKEWMRGLHIAAMRYKYTPMVVGMSLRNELRGPLQNKKVWYKYMEEGATRLHKSNPKLVIIISGLYFDLNLGFLNATPLKLNFKNKLVYEMHQYAFSKERQFWLNQPFSEACRKITQQIHREGGFLVEGENAAPLFVSEFGINQEKTGRVDSSFLDCFMDYLTRSDLDWSVWALQGSYYVRKGIQGFDETFGMLDSNWSSIRNPGFLRRLHRIIQQKLN